MLVAIVYPLVDGGLTQIAQVYRGLTSRGSLSWDQSEIKDNGTTSESGSGSVSERTEEKGDSKEVQASKSS